jgi:putative Mg2+ transporter-C (MgtC) family protein
MSTWQEIWQTLQAEFGDLPDAAAVVRIIVRLAVAGAIGALLGSEREAAGKAAGLRTHMLVALGAAMFVLVPQQAGVPLEQMSRVFQGIIAGIGFLGAGAILKLSEERVIKGLTTAASIWLTAAAGAAAGLGRETTAILGGLVAFGILTGLRRLEVFWEKFVGQPHARGGGAEVRHEE